MRWLLGPDAFYELLMQSLTDAVAQKWTGRYLRLLAVTLAYGAFVHVANILGIGGRPWSGMPLHWRAMDVVLLVFNLVVAIGLWVKKPWAIVTLFTGIVLLQIIPYTVFQRHFIETPQDADTLNGLIGAELLLLAILAVLLLVKK